MEGLISDYSRIPKDAVIINELHIVEFMKDDGIFKIDLSSSNSESGLPDFDDTARLINWANAMNLSSFLIQEIEDIGGEVVSHDEDDNDDDDDNKSGEPVKV